MRRAPKTRVFGTTGLTALVLAGCVEYEDPPISWEGEIIRFGADEPEAVCGGSLEWMDARALALAETFAAAGAEVYPRVDYYWLTESWGEQDVCPDADGCAVNNVIRSRSVPHEHELVHALRPDNLPLVFEEGLATLYGDLGYIAATAPREELLPLLEKPRDLEPEEYLRVGHFVAFLVESYGLETLLAMGKENSRWASWTQTQAAFAEAYGFPLQDALVEYEDYPDCAVLAWENVDIACEQEPALIDLPHDGSGVVLSQQIACTEPDVLGPLWGRMFTETTIELTNLFGGGVFVRMLGDESSEAMIVVSGCGGCSDTAWVWLREGEADQFVSLPTGRYVVRMFRPIDDPGESAVSLSLFE